MSYILQVFFNITSMSSGQWSVCKGYGPPDMPPTIQLTETMCYIGQVKVEDRKGYPMVTAGMQVGEPSVYSLCTGYWCKANTDIIVICCRFQMIIAAVIWISQRTVEGVLATWGMAVCI